MTRLREIGMPGQEIVQHTHKWKSPSHPKCLVFSFGVKKGDIVWGGGSEVLKGGFCSFWTEPGRQLHPLLPTVMLSWANQRLGCCNMPRFGVRSDGPYMQQKSSWLRHNQHCGCVKNIFNLHIKRVQTNASWDKRSDDEWWMCLLPGYKWTSKTPSSTVSISSSAITGKKQE